MMNFNLFKIFGIVSSIIILIIFLSGSIMGIINAYKNHDYKEALKATGGRLFSLDYSLQQETNLLLNSTSEQINTNSQDSFYKTSSIIFHVIYSFILIFMFIIIIIFLFKIIKWFLGPLQPWWVDISVIILIIIMFFTLEFLYEIFIFKTKLIPIKDGIWFFIKNIPAISTNLL